MKTKYYSQEDFDRDCLTIAYHIKAKNQSYDVIVALGRGGIPAGTRLAHLLNVPLKVVPYSLKDPSRHHEMRFVADQIRDQRILVIDDISDSGKTLDEIAAHLDGEDFHTATLIYKPQSIYRPTYFAFIHMGDEWIQFVWEEDLIST